MTDTTNHKQNPPKKKESNTRLLIIILILTNVAWAAVFFMTRFSYKETEETLTKEKTEALAKIDELETELDDKIVQIEELGGDVAELTALKQELEEEREKLQKANRWTSSQLARFRDKVEGYEELLRRKDDEIAKLEEVNEILLTENTELKTEKENLSKEKSELELSKQSLEEKVEVASRLKAENIRVYAVNRRGKEREGEFKSRQIDQLKIQFVLAENKVAPVGGKDILIRILEPEGNVLFDVANGSGTFMYNDKEEFFTQKQNILYDRNSQELTYLYDKGSEYKQGTHTLEVYADDYRIGSTTFTVK